MRFFVLRHGQTDWNAQQRLQGMTDIALNDKGRAQARKAAQFLLDQKIDTIIASPMSRAFETAQIVAEHLKIETQTDPRLAERGFGRFEGLNFAEVAQYRQEMSEHMRRDPDLDGFHYPHDAETLSDVITRVRQSLEAHLLPERTCLFVTHGVPFRIMAKHYVGEMYSSPNCAPTLFSRKGDQWSLMALDPDNAPVPHLQNGPTTMGRL